MLTDIVTIVIIINLRKTHSIIPSKISLSYAGWKNTAQIQQSFLLFVALTLFITQHTKIMDRPYWLALKYVTSYTINILNDFEIRWKKTEQTYKLCDTTITLLKLKSHTHTHEMMFKFKHKKDVKVSLSLLTTYLEMKKKKSNEFQCVIWSKKSKCSRFINQYSRFNWFSMNMFLNKYADFSIYLL